jgi:outer membrane protein assembly factor BamB
LSGHDAKSGKLLWDHGNFNPRQQSNWRVIASAAATRGIALVPFGRGNHVAGVRMGGSGDTTKTQRLWTLDKRGSDCATPAAHDGKFYLLQDNGPTRGTVSCLDAETGKVLWETVLPKGPAIYYASPMIAGDRLYCGRSDGTIFCGRITDGGLVDVNANALGEPLVATPVAVGDSLLVRTHEHLWCFR